MRHRICFFILCNSSGLGNQWLVYCSYFTPFNVTFFQILSPVGRQLWKPNNIECISLNIMIISIVRLAFIQYGYNMITSKSKRCCVFCVALLWLSCVCVRLAFVHLLLVFIMLCIMFHLQNWNKSVRRCSNFLFLHFFPVVWNNRWPFIGMIAVFGGGNISTRVYAFIITTKSTATTQRKH